METVHPTDRDVLCGRGPKIFRHPGNEAFRELISCYKEKYLSASTIENKRKVSWSIVKAIRSKHPIPGRFLQKKPNGIWFEIGHLKAVEKTIAAMNYHVIRSKTSNKTHPRSPKPSNNTKSVEWETLPSMNYKRFFFGATVVDSNGKKIIVGGGRNRDTDFSLVEEYDFRSKEWKLLPNMTEQRLGCTIVSACNKIYAIGGISSRRQGQSNVLKSVESYCMGDDTWKHVPDMTHARKHFAACTVHDKIYVMGGEEECSSSSSSASVEVFNVKTQMWSTLPSTMLECRKYFAAVAVGEKIYVFGGHHQSKGYREFLASAEVLDTRTETWSSLPPMNRKRSGCAAAAIVGNKICVLGGLDGSNLQSSGELYDINTNTWSSIPSMTMKKHGCAAVSIENKLYVMGGLTLQYFEQTPAVTHKKSLLSSMEVLVMSEPTNPDIPTPLLQSKRKQNTKNFESPTPCTKRLKGPTVSGINSTNVVEQQEEKQNDDNTNKVEGGPEGEEKSQSYEITQPPTNVQQTRMVSPSNQDAMSTCSTLKGVYDRVSLLEKSTSALRKRVEQLEIDLCGVISNNGDSILQRIQALERLETEF